MADVILLYSGVLDITFDGLGPDRRRSRRVTKKSYSAQHARKFLPVQEGLTEAVTGDLVSESWASGILGIEWGPHAIPAARAEPRRSDAGTSMSLVLVLAD